MRTSTLVIVYLCLSYLGMAQSASNAQGLMKPMNPIAHVSAISHYPASIGGGKGDVIVTIKLNGPNYHINSNKPADAYAIPTTVIPTKDATIAWGKPIFPRTKDVYKGVVDVDLPFVVTAKAKPGVKTVQITVNYQACNDTSCFPPTTTKATAQIILAKHRK